MKCEDGRDQQKGGRDEERRSRRELVKRGAGKGSQRKAHALSDHVEASHLALRAGARAQAERGEVSRQHQTERHAEHDQRAEQLHIDLRQCCENEGEGCQWRSDRQQHLRLQPDDAQQSALHDIIASAIDMSERLALVMDASEEKPMASCSRSATTCCIML